MLCEIADGRLLETWMAMSVLGALSLCMMSGIVFYALYAKPSHRTWQYKFNPAYPQPEKVVHEIVQMFKGIATATIPPALSLWLSAKGMSQAYCGDRYSTGYHIFQFIAIVLGSDLFEWYYHRLGHVTEAGWKEHRHHHVFFNPTPFAVISDEIWDQLYRAMPLLVFPLIMPTNMDLLFATYAIFFYSYGIVLHAGFALPWDDVHATPKIRLCAFHHYFHHARSIKNKPLYTGFFFLLWDQLAGSTLPEEKCVCDKCCREKGLRTKEQFEKLTKPDYSKLLIPRFWLNCIQNSYVEQKTA